MYDSENWNGDMTELYMCVCIPERSPFTSMVFPARALSPREDLYPRLNASIASIANISRGHNHPLLSS